MHVYLTTSPKADALGYRKRGDEELPHFVWNNITYGDYNENRVVQFDVKFPEVRLLLLGFELNLTR